MPTRGAGVCGTEGWASEGWVWLAGALCGAWAWTSGQGEGAALWEAGHSEQMTGKEECAASAVTGHRLAGVGPETDPLGSPGGAWREGEACVRGQAEGDVAREASAWAHDASWVTTEVVSGVQEAEPESTVNVERAASEGGGTRPTG